QPQDQVGTPGVTINLSVVAEGTEPMTYHWRRNGSFLPAANSPALALPAVQTIDAGGYDVIVENDFGSATSRVASVTVYSLPSLEPVPDVLAEVLRPLVVHLVVHDSNQPPLLFTWSLAPGAPTNAYIHSLTGRFSWTPTRAHAPGTYAITAR